MTGRQISICWASGITIGASCYSVVSNWRIGSHPLVLAILLGSMVTLIALMTGTEKK